MKMRAITVGRFPDGSWTTGGPVSDSIYQDCEVYLTQATSDAEAKKKAQSVRRRLLDKGHPLPTQSRPYPFSEIAPTAKAEPVCEPQLDPGHLAQTRETRIEFELARKASELL